MTEKEKMVAGLLYNASDDELVSARRNCKIKIYDYNLIDPREPDEKEQQLLKNCLTVLVTECG